MKRLASQVEPLSDEQWGRIERGLLEKLAAEEGALAEAPRSEAAPARHRVPRAAWAIVAAVAAIVVLALGVELFARGGHPMANPSRIATGASESHVVLGANSADVAPDSTLLVSGDDEQGMLLVLERGAVTCDVAPRRGRPPIIVSAGDTRVRVVGTRFTVTRIGDTARVDVAHGTVEVSAHGATVLVRDGESWPPAPTGVAPTPTGAAPDPSGAGAPAQQQSPTPSSATAAPTALAQAPSTRPKPSAAPPSDPPPAPPATAAPSAPSPQELFETAAKLEAANPSRAIAIYAQVAAGGGAWAANALFAQARLEALRGNRVEARRLLGQYLARYPRGPNASDARALLERLR